MLREVRAHRSGQAGDGLARFHGGTAKFHDNHKEKDPFEAQLAKGEQKYGESKAGAEAIAVRAGKPSKERLLSGSSFIMVTAALAGQRHPVSRYGESHKEGIKLR
jgi:hypothetical protein